MTTKVQPVSAPVGSISGRYSGMLGVRKHLQVLNPVVGLVPVDVVNVLIGAKGATKVALHNQAMPFHPHLLFVNPDPALDVALRVHPPRLRLCVVAAVV